jgi:hypothetical protein
LQRGIIDRLRRALTTLQPSSSKPVEEGASALSHRS